MDPFWGQVWTGIFLNNCEALAQEAKDSLKYNCVRKQSDDWMEEKSIWDVEHKDTAYVGVLWKSTGSYNYLEAIGCKELGRCTGGRIILYLTLFYSFSRGVCF